MGFSPRQALVLGYSPRQALGVRGDLLHRRPFGHPASVRGTRLMAGGSGFQAPLWPQALARLPCGCDTVLIGAPTTWYSSPWQQWPPSPGVPIARLLLFTATTVSFILRTNSRITPVPDRLCASRRCSARALPRLSGGSDTLVAQGIVTQRPVCCPGALGWELPG